MPVDIVNVRNQEEFEEVLIRTLAPGTEIHLNPPMDGSQTDYIATRSTEHTIVIKTREQEDRIIDAMLGRAVTDRRETP